MGIEDTRPNSGKEWPHNNKMSEEKLEDFYDNLRHDISTHGLQKNSPLFKKRFDATADTKSWGRIKHFMRDINSKKIKLSKDEFQIILTNMKKVWVGQDLVSFISLANNADLGMTDHEKQELKNKAIDTIDIQKTSFYVFITTLNEVTPLNSSELESLIKKMLQSKTGNTDIELFFRDERNMLDTISNTLFRDVIKCITDNESDNENRDSVILDIIKHKSFQNKISDQQFHSLIQKIVEVRPASDVKDFFIVEGVKKRITNEQFKTISIKIINNDHFYLTERFVASLTKEEKIRFESIKNSK